MELNKESLENSNKLDFELDRPVLSKYMVNVEHRGKQYYTEMSHQDWMCYTKRQALNIDNYNGFNAFDGKYDVPYYGDIEEVLVLYKIGRISLEEAKRLIKYLTS